MWRVLSHISEKCTLMADTVKKVIITGPTGAVGVSLIEELCSKGISVTAVCRPNSKRISSKRSCVIGVGITKSVLFITASARLRYSCA